PGAALVVGLLETHRHHVGARFHERIWPAGTFRSLLQPRVQDAGIRKLVEIEIAVCDRDMGCLRSRRRVLSPRIGSQEGRGSDQENQRVGADHGESPRVVARWEPRAIRPVPRTEETTIGWDRKRVAADELPTGALRIADLERYRAQRKPNR